MTTAQQERAQKNIGLDKSALTNKINHFTKKQNFWDIDLIGGIYMFGDLAIIGDGTKAVFYGDGSNLTGIADTNTQLSDADIAAMGYIKTYTDTNTQRTNAEINALINEKGFITSYVNTQLSDADIANMGYIKTYIDTQLSDADIANMGYIKSYTDTNTQRTDEEIRDVAAAQWVNGTNTTVVKSDGENTIKIHSPKYTIK